MSDSRELFRHTFSEAAINASNSRVNPAFFYNRLAFRVEHDQKKRFENLEQPVKGNTDFDKIVSGDDFFFAAKLDRMVSSGEYRNTTEKWLQWYKSTVVVPIRVLEKNWDENKKHYILLGFLCADSDSSGAFEEDRATLYADIVMAAADQLYYFLDFISSQRNRLKTDSSNQL
ncbi:MAG: hypothetical protein P4L38_11895 [Syntrophaceae bacterium]|nr:hypothetical protein [Syntrophaceae bacterium]